VGARVEGRPPSTRLKVRVQNFRVKCYPQYNAFSWPPPPRPPSPHVLNQGLCSSIPLWVLCRGELFAPANMRAYAAIPPSPSSAIVCKSAICVSNSVPRFCRRGAGCAQVTSPLCEPCALSNHDGGGAPDDGPPTVALGDPIGDEGLG
jgi:hypothetical protein